MGVHCSTIAVAANDNVANAQIVDGEVDGRRRARSARMAIRWHEVSDVAQYEQIARIGRRKHVYSHPAVRTGDKQSIRLLPQCQLAKGFG